MRNVLDRIRDLAGSLDAAQAVLAGEAAAHLYLALASGMAPGDAPRYAALPLRRIEALVPGLTAPPGVAADASPVAAALKHRLDLFTTSVTLSDGTRIPVLTREAVMAQLLSQGGLALGLAGALLRVTGDPLLDRDEVREILKSARQGERYQPLLELLEVA